MKTPCVVSSLRRRSAANLSSCLQIEAAWLMIIATLSMLSAILQVLRTRHVGMLPLNEERVDGLVHDFAIFTCRVWRRRLKLGFNGNILA